MKYILILFILMSSSLKADKNVSSKQLSIDSSRIEVRYPSNSSLDKFKFDKDFFYDESHPSNWWDAFWLWVDSKLLKLLGSKTFGFFQKYLGYLIILAAIIIVILFLNRSKFSGLFYNRREEKISGFKELKENINEIDFDMLISEASVKKEYRIAVRLNYLRTLKLLSENKLIDLNVNKTNSNYLKEIKKADIKKPFEELTYLFEWIWYGELPVDDSLFEQTKISFNNFHEKVEAAQ